MITTLKEARLAAGLRQVDLARKAGVDQPTISYHENRARRGPHHKVAYKLAWALDTNPAELWPERYGEAA